MLTDVILSGLTNLFALFGATKDVDVRYSKRTLKDYLTRHFGIRDVSVYIALYEELRDFYSLSPDLDKDAIINGICQNLASQMHAEEQALILLRLMEFCDTRSTKFDRDEYVFRGVARCFGINDELYNDFCCFIEDEESEHVTIQRYEKLEGYITVLWLHDYNKLVFTYHGREKILMDDVPVTNGMYQTWTQSGVVKVQKTGLRIYYYNAFRAYLSEQDVQRIEFCGRSINFRFPGSDNGIHDMSFTLTNGQLLAIMGGSGTGKTTLLSLLNGTLSPQSGTITLNGHAINEPQSKALIGFVSQDDILIEELTVYENLMFTARLCFEGVSDEELDRRVTNTLNQLGLLAIKDLKVGSPLQKTISGGQRKRVNIALELIREPAVLFLDEPTSGLSSSDTEKVISLLKEQAYKGRLIITNIHQPSSDVYKMFDRLWLLDKGGYPVFDGNPIDAVTYFKTAANYVDADSSTCPTCGNVNPEIVLNIIDEKALDGSGQLTEERKVSPKEWHDMYLDNMEDMPEPEVIDIPHNDQKKPGVFKQFYIYLCRNFRTKATNLQYLIITLLEAPVLAAICAMLTRYSSAEGYTVMDNKNMVSYIFMSVIVATFVGMSGTAEEIIKDRLLLKREKFLSLSYGSYISSKIAYMALIVAVQTLLYLLVGNTIMGLCDLFFTWWLAMFAVAFLSGLIGLLLSQCLNSIVSIYISIPVLLIPQILLCGVVVNYSDLTPNSTTGNVPLIGDVIPSRWAYEAIAVSQFKDNEFEKDLFDTHKEKYEATYYKNVVVYEMQSQLEMKRDEEQNAKPVLPEHMDVIKKALPIIADVVPMPEYQGAYDYASLRKYTDEAKDKLMDRSNKATLKEDGIVTERLRLIGKEAFKEMKRSRYNLRLEEMVANLDVKHTHDIVDGYIVPRVGLVFLTPRTDLGKAPFYSSVKIIGGKQIPTLWFNISMLTLYSLLLMLLLYNDCLGRFMRK